MTAPSAGPAPFIWPPRYIGDDWSFAYTYTNPDGSPFDLTGAQPQAILFARDQIVPVFTMAEAPAVTVKNASAGQVVFTVARALTGTLRADGDADGYPTRIQILLLDSVGRLTTLRVDGVCVLDARFAPLAIPSADIVLPIMPPTPVTVPTVA